MARKLVLSLACLAMVACIVQVYWHYPGFNQQMVFDTFSLVTSLALVGAAWRLVSMTGNGRNALRQYFMFVLASSAWLLFLDSLAIIWHVPDIIPRVVRVIMYRGLVLIGMIWFTGKIHELSRKL